MPDMTDQELNELYARKRKADRELRLDVSVRGITADTVQARAVPTHPGLVNVELGGINITVDLAGQVTELRAVAQEIDRQLAHLEVEGRVDAAVTDVDEAEG